MDSNKYRISLRKVTLGIIGLLFFLLLVGVYEFTKIRKQTYDNLTEALQNTMNVGILNLENNELRILPKEIGQLRNLKTLHLLNNRLRTLPKEIRQLQNLRTLYLTGYLSNRNKLSSQEEREIQELLPKCAIK